MMDQVPQTTELKYRVYALSPEGHMINSAYFEAENDTLAIAWARDWHPPAERELWQAHRKVLTIAPRDDGAARASRPSLPQENNR